MITPSSATSCQRKRLIDCEASSRSTSVPLSPVRPCTTPVMFVLTVRYMTTPDTTTSATTIAVNSTTRRVVARAKTSGPGAGLTMTSRRVHARRP